MPRSLLDPRPVETEPVEASPGPTLAETIGAVIAAHTCFDDGKRMALLDALRSPRHQSNGNGHDDRRSMFDVALSPAVSRSFLPGLVERSRFGSIAGPSGPPLARAATGFPGSAGGFALPLDMSPDIADRARATRGPWSMCSWWPVETREYLFPAVNEPTRLKGSRYGGFNAQWGLSETTLPAESDGSLAQVQLTQNRLLMFTTISRDVWSDARKIQRWLSYIGMANLRDLIEESMIAGALNGPMGAINSPATVVVNKAGTAAGSISATNIDMMWASMYRGCKDNAVWHANDQTVAYLDELNVSGQFPENLYFPAGSSPMGTPFATIKGRPLYPTEFAPNLGNPGDLVCVDWTQYVFSYLQPRPEDSALSFSVQVPDDQFHKGMRGIPEGVVEQRVSSELYFQQDLLALVFKFRGDGAFIWSAPVLQASGGGQFLGPAAVIAPR